MSKQDRKQFNFMLRIIVTALGMMFLVTYMMSYNGNAFLFTI